MTHIMQNNKRTLSSRRALVMALLAATCLAHPAAALAQLKSATSATTVITAPNGVPVVNIANPNSAGLSHNQFLDYNVGANGVVLNNGDSSQMQRQSQLAGAVSANLGLTHSASVILNEVVSTNRSELDGYTEVVGASADVVVANPNGITCSGCGFINTPHATLTTGNPVINAGGALTGFHVDNGDILITGAGIDGSKSDYLGLIARSVALQGQVNAKQLDVVAGTNDFDYATGAVTANAPTGTAPTLAIDSSALGGMYADRIRLVATEAGVGVRVLGDAAAGTGDFTLDGAGTIEVGSHISAANGDVKVTSTATGADAIKANVATISAHHDINLTALSGQVHLLGGVLTAGNDLDIASDTLDDVSTTDTITDNNKRYAGGNLSLTQTGAATLGAGAIWGANGTLSLSADNLVIDAGASIESVTGGVSLAGNGLSNAGTISAAADGVTIRTDGTITNSGTIYSAGLMDIADGAGAGTEDVTNSGTLLSGSNFAISVATLTNSGKIQEAGGGTITAATVNINPTGLINLATNAASTGTINATTLTDNGGLAPTDGGGLQSTGGMTLHVSGTLTVGSTKNTKILSGGNMTITAGTLSLFSSGSAIIDQSASGTASITVSNALTNIGALYSAHDLSVFAPSITNTGTGGIAAAGTLHVHATGSTLDNFGSLYAGTLLDAQAITTLTNENLGTLDGGLDITVNASTFINHYDINAARNMTITAATFRNEVVGGDTRRWNYQDDCSPPNPCFDPGGPHFEGATFVQWGNAGDQDSHAQANNGDHSAVINYTDSENENGPWDDNGDITDRWHATFDTYQYYSGGTPSHKPLLVAGNALTIQNFNQGYNTGGIISAPTVTINGNGGSTFTNDDLSLVTLHWTADWNNYLNCDTSFQTSCDPWINFRSYDKVVTSTTTDSSFGAGIFADSLSITNTSLNNTSSVARTGHKTASVDPISSTGNSGSIANFGGINVTLPTNPNGFFVVSQDPNSKYLIETNPLYSVGSSFLGSDYMLTTYGVDPDNIERRLGDANYEAALIRDQLLNQGAASLLNGATDEASAMQKLMDNGIDQGKKLGLTVGVAPTAAQLASLGSDIVWMVDTVVGGQHVLAPVVYLSAATQSQIAGGAVISATNANLQLASLTNTGGTISGSSSLNITTEGDITNTSGTIKGGDVSLTSTNGNIVNETYAGFSGGSSGNTSTTIGKTGSIEATGNLSLDAKNDITNKGANMSAGGDASLNAGNNITFDTVEDKESTKTYSGSNGALSGGTETESSTSSTTNIKSGLTVGGNLSSHSGSDTTFAGTDVNVGGNADLDAGGNLNIIARNDSTETTTSSSSGTVFSGDSTTTHDRETTNVASNFNVGGNLNSNSKGDTTIQGSNVNVTGDGSVTAGGKLNILDGQNTSDVSSSSTHTGAGVGGGLYGTSTTTDTDQKGTSVASNINFGGNGSLKAGNDITVQGSNVGSGGDMNVDAGNNVNILEGRNTETTTHTESTTTIGKIDNGSGYEAPQKDPDAEEEQGGVNAHAEASADANDTENGGVTLTETDTNSTTHHTDTASGSGITSGGNMNINAGNDVTIRGSNVDAGGDASVNAGGNVNVLAAENIDTTTTTSSTSKTGLYGTSNNDANADAQANAHAEADGEGSPEASADASASAGATTGNTVDVERYDSTSTTTTDITHTGSAVHSGGNMNVVAGNDLNVNGSSLDSGGDMNLNAKDMNFTVATDSHTETTNDSHTRAGLYADAGASADASVGANAQGVSAGGEAEANAGANAGVGLYGTNTTNSSTDGSTTAQTSSIHSGGNMTRTATGDIHDVGTQIDAGGDFTQSSTTWESDAAHNTTFSSSSSETNTAKLGLYAEANANAGGSASTMDGVDQDAGADASVGVSASYNRNTDSETSNSSNAVVSNIHSGGNMTTTTTGKTSLEGTNLDSGGDMTLNASSLDYKAAQDTSSSSSSTSNIDANLKVGIDASKTVTGSLDGGYQSGDSSESSTHGVAGSMTSGGNLHVNTTGDANFEGTNIAATGDAGIKAGGDVNFSAVHDTHTSSETNLGVSASITASKNKSKGKNGAGFDAEGSYDTSTESSDTETAGSITSGGNLDVSAGKSATFEGTKLNAGGDASVEATDNVNFNAAKSTTSSSGWGVSANIGVGKETEGGSTEKKGAVGLGGSYNQSSSTTSDAAGITSGGNLKVKAGNDVNLEGTNITSGGTASLDAGHDVNFKAAENTSSSVGFSAEIGGETSKKTEAGKEPEKENGGKIGLDVSGSTSDTKTGGSIHAGSISIHSGNDTTLEGTQTQSAGNTSINAGGNVNLASADSTNFEGGIGGGVGSKGGGLTKASIGGGSDSQGVSMQSGGDTTITSGGKTTMEGTQITADGAATVDAAGGVDKSTTVSGGADLGLDHAGADLSVQTTTITSKNSVPPPPADFQKALAAIQNDPSLTQAQKTKAMADKIKNDPTLTQAQKDKLLADLAKSQTSGH